MADPVNARIAAEQLRAAAEHLNAAVLTLVAGGVPIPVAQHLRKAVTSVEHTACMLEELARA